MAERRRFVDRLWAPEWHSVNRLDGETRHLMWRPAPGGSVPALFRTRRECRAYIDQTVGYIRNRPDLRAEPHGWRVPQAVRVVVERSHD